MVNRCLARAGRRPVSLNLDFTWWTSATVGPAHSLPSAALVQSCIDASRRAQLRPYVAPPALLFITGLPGQVTGVQLSAGGRIRIAEVSAAILLLAVTVTIVVSSRLVRPLSRLTAAVQDPSGPHRRLPVTSGDEIGRLTATFNDFADHRRRMEAQRTAMVSDIAHELRTPLVNIRGWLEAAEDGLAVSDHAFVASLLEESLLLQRIIDDLQHLAAADAGQFRLHPEAVHVRDLLDQVATAHRSAASAAGITLGVQVDDDVEIQADPVRLRQAVGNLVANALRHTPADGTVTIGCRSAEPGLVISVTDTGTGIAAADLQKVFDRFWRADKSRSRRTGGSGLGLPISRQLIEAHGGTIGVTSAPGEGTVFTIVLPHRRAEGAGRQ
jgi:two-component system sensor histidine kinase BaeS